MAPQPSWLRAAASALPAATVPGALLIAALVLVGGRAAAQDLARVERRLNDIDAEAKQLRGVPLRRSQLRSSTFVEERLTDGELLFRLKDYIRASVVLTDIVDNYPQHRAYPDAVHLLAESLFHAGDYLGARKRYREIIERADQPGFKQYVAHALGRLIEIAIHTGDYSGVDAYFQRLNQLPPSEIESATNYFRAKYLYARATQQAEGPHQEVAAAGVDRALLDQARAVFASVPRASAYFARARYFVGVIDVLSGNLQAALASFNAVARSKPANEEERRVVDLAKLALGRVNYELDRLDPAIAAYQSVDRTSPLFDSALYELSWVFIRMGDSTRAERALEVLSVAVPESQHIPDAKILRGNLLLRNGRFDAATAVFDEASKQFEPVKEQLARVVAEHSDPQAYFRQLVRENLDAFDAEAFLPAEARRWTDTSGDMDRAMVALSDVAEAREQVAETASIIERLSSALLAPNPVNVFRDLRAHRERSTALRNRLALVRKQLAAVMARQAGKAESPELEQVRAERKQLERSLRGLPDDPEEMAARADRTAQQFVAIDKELSKLDVELLGMEARITASKRFLHDTAPGRDPAAVDAAESELQTHEAALDDYRASLAELRIESESGRLQVGVGDDDDEREAQLRQRYAELVEREHQLLRAQGASIEPRVEVALARVDQVEQTLDAHDQAIDAVTQERIAHMRTVLREESENLTGYRTRLAELEGESEDVVGGIAYANFRAVQQRFYDLVLRADVGGIDVAWAVREEHRMRAEMLTRERTRALQALDDEFRDIMDEGGAR